MRIGPPLTSAERRAALGRLFQGDPCVWKRVDHAIQLAETGQFDLNGLIATWNGEEAVAAGAFCLAPDGAGLVWPPEVTDAVDSPDAVVLTVFDAIAERAVTYGCPFLQTAIAPDRQDHRRRLQAAGFTEIGELISLQHPLGRSLPEAGLLHGRRITLTSSNEARFAALIERIGIGSQDSLAFTGVRTAHESLRSYRTAGLFTPDRWLLIEVDGCDAGLILVNDRPDERAREIVYFGVDPELRGRGIGRALVSSVLHEAAASRCDSVLAAVDAKNRPAQEIYFGTGFFETGRRIISFRSLVG